MDDNCSAQLPKNVTPMARQVVRRTNLVRPSTPHAPLTCAVSVTFGNAHDADELLLDLARQASRIAVALVHNGPDFGSRAEAETHADQLVAKLTGIDSQVESLALISAGTNLGYSKALNLGEQVVREEISSPSYVWLLNADLAVAEGSLTALLAAASARPDVWCWGSTTLDPDGQKSGLVEYSILSGRRHQRFVEDLSVEPGVESPIVGRWWDFRRRFVRGAAMFIPAAGFAHLRGLDSGYFLYFEELDLSERIGRLNKLIGWVPQSRIVHQGNVSSSRVPRPAHFVAMHSTTSYMRYLRRHHPLILPLGVLRRVVLGTVFYGLRWRWDAALGTLHGAAAATRRNR